jgi:hypothetical protein
MRKSTAEVAAITGFGAENGTVPTDRYDLDLDWGNVSPTRCHRFLTSFIYELPFNRWAKSSRFADLVVGGWNFSGVSIASNGSLLHAGG